MTDEESRLKTIRFCDKCGRNVRAYFRTETVQMPIYGQMRDISFPIAACPFCESVLCERGFDEVFMDAVMQRKAELEQTGRINAETKGA